MTTTLKQFQIPFFKPTIGEEEIAHVNKVLRSGWLTTGGEAREFEKEFAAYVGAEFAVAVSSCTAALHLSLEALGLQAGDEVLIPTLTFASTGEVIQHLGGKPVLVDVLPDTLLMDPAQLEKRITPRTKAIIPVHYGGQPCHLNEIIAIARRHGLHVVEDAAHAVPASYQGRRIGGIGDLTCFSFYANKTLTTGEGGMVTTNNEAWAKRVRLMSLHGITKDAWKRFSAEGTWDYEIVAPGYKSNLTDMAAAIGREQLKRADELLARRVAIAHRYDNIFSGESAIRIPTQLDDRTNAWHLYVIRIQPGRLSIDRNTFIQKLGAAGVGTSVHYRPLHMHPLYAEKYNYQPEHFPVAKQAFEQMLSLPLYPLMTDADVDFVGEAVLRIVREAAV